MGASCQRRAGERDLALDAEAVAEPGQELQAGAERWAALMRRYRRISFRRRLWAALGHYLRALRSS